MIKNKLGASLAMNTIIIAIIGLIVLIVLIAMFTGKVNLFSSSTETCYSKGGECLKSDKPICEPDEVTMYTKDCQFYPASDETKNRLGQCCVKLK